jgi:hypothetical protein
MALENPIGSGVGPLPEFDETLPGGGGVISAINQYRIASEDARRQVITQSDRNWQTYLGKQDWSHKQAGQSSEFLPKVPVSVEQLAALFKRGMIQFGDYFSVDIDQQLGELVSGAQLRSMLKPFLNDLWGPNNNPERFSTVVSDGVKVALLKRLFILKVHGGFMTRKKFEFERGEDGAPKVRDDTTREWHLRMDLVRLEDYYPDPTGAGLYEIHRVERDYHEVESMAEDGVYDAEVVKRIRGFSHERPEDEDLDEADKNQGETTPPGFRKRVLLDEFWGTILDANGRPAHRNCVATVANERYLIRKPEPNPFWHQESPFVVAPLVRVPHSVWHKAIYDHASDLNLAINEMFNLMLDGGIAAVWGIKQLRTEDLEDPSQVENGIKQGVTLAVKQTLPHKAKVLETVSEGDVPKDAMAVFEFLNREFTSAAMTNELKLGALPPKQVLATEVLEASQSQNLMLDGIVADVEVNVIAEALRKAFLCVLQNAEDIPEVAFTSATDKKVALAIMRASPEERFSLFAGRCQFRVSGLSATMTRALDFQKVMALLQAVGTQPLLLQAFMRKFSPDRTLEHLIRTLNINPENIEKTLEEQSQDAQAEEAKRTEGAAALIGQGPQNSEGKPGGVASGAGTGGDPQTAAIQQAAQPMMGLPGNA